MKKVNRSAFTLHKAGAKFWYVWSDKGYYWVMVLDGQLWEPRIINSLAPSDRCMCHCTYMPI